VHKRASGQVKINADIDASNGRKIFGNATEIYKVISNLCLNSIQSMPETGGEITVNVGYLEGETGLSERYPGLQDGDYLKISVQDNGSGMSMDTVQKMYLPFYSGSEVAEGARKRAGLGLTSVHNIVSSQGGLITVDSELGRGTLFEIFLPLISSEISDSDAEATQSEAGTAAKRIMLVDDEPPILEMATRMLTRGGFKVVGYLDGNEALDNFKKHPYEFDLIITDLIMPSISGSELASQISALNPNVPIILSTGFSDKISKSTCSSWGVDRVVNKPFKMRELLSTVESLS
jgi:two-component system cell cycle sensor histidine kinase/response regulator CckA